MRTINIEIPVSLTDSAKQALAEFKRLRDAKDITGANQAWERVLSASLALTTFVTDFAVSEGGAQ